MVYQPNIPNATDAIKNSQADVQRNFQSIGTAFDKNHGDFNSAIPGQHVVVQMPVQVATPNPPFAATDVALYNLNDAITTKSEMYVHKIQNATTAEIPMTASILSTSTPLLASSGWTYLPSGIIMKWGNVTVPVPTSPDQQVIVFPVAADIPVFSVCIQVMITPVLQDNAGGTSAWSPTIYTGSTKTTGFNIRFGYSSSGFSPFYAAINYLAIGY